MMILNLLTYLLYFIFGNEVGRDVLDGIFSEIDTLDAFLDFDLTP